MISVVNQNEMILNQTQIDTVAFVCTHAKMPIVAVTEMGDLHCEPKLSDFKNLKLTPLRFFAHTQVHDDFLHKAFSNSQK